MSKNIKKSLYLTLILLALVGAYFYLANAFIYYRIGAGNLAAPAIKNVYMINNNDDSRYDLMYVALGDSLTTGAGATRHDETFPYQIAEKLSASGDKVAMKNFSYPGAKTQDLINDLLDGAVVAQPDVITLLIGVNDIHNHISAEQFRLNYKYILDKLTQKTKAKIYVVNIPLIGSDTVILPPLDIYFDAQTKKFNDIIKDLSVEYQVAYIDLYSPTKDLLRYDGLHYSSDSFHPSASGYKMWADIIYDNFDK